MEAVEGQVNLDDLTTNRPGGVVRTKAPGMVRPLTPPSIQKESYPLLEYLDEIKTQRTGFSRTSMGMDADALQSTTQKAVEASMQNAQEKIELVARVYAETGVKRLFRLILALVNKYQNFERMIRLRGGFVAMDPREWHQQFDLQINVGLGNGRDEEKLAMLQQLRQDQKEILFNMGPGNPIVGSAQYAASGRRMAELVGFKDTDIFYRDPRQVVQQERQQAQQPQQSPEMLEHQRKMREMELEHQRKTEEQEQELARQRREFEQKMSLEWQRAQANLELERQKAAAQYNIDLAKLRSETAIKEMEAEAYQDQVRQSGENEGGE
jgi:hypothetical protein